jgi:hypothetical protein
MLLLLLLLLLSTQAYAGLDFLMSSKCVWGVTDEKFKRKSGVDWG